MNSPVLAVTADEIVIRLALEKGLLAEHQLASARASVEMRVDPNLPAPRLLDLLAAEGILGGEKAAKLLADEFGMEWIDASALHPTAEAIELVSRTIAARHRLLPLARIGQTLRVAVSDPFDTDGVDSLSHRLNLTIEPIVAPAVDIAREIDRFYGKVESASNDPSRNISADGSRAMVAAAGIDHAASNSTDDAPIIRLVHALIAEAIRRRASDIHLEPLEKRFRVRYRIDGVLLEVENPPKHLQLAIVSRLKIMANISIAEKRVPQDGRIQIALDGRALDLRVSSLPTAHGESIVMRILDKESLQLGLPELGFFRDDQAVFERLIASPDGIVLVTGPTGSGKTTTLYGCLHAINQPDRKIITVEDPVEYQLTGINQVPVRHDIGMTFASALRAMLRQAPNVVMIGEIRDLETAEIAINASLTGHLVFSTLHTNDAPGAVTRLIDLGVKPFLVSTALRATMAQRLVRKICLNCRRPYSPSPQELRALDLDASGNPTGCPMPEGGAMFSRGAGCAACNGTGYRGRMGIFEIFPVNEEIQRMIYEHAGAARLRAKARALGMRTMREDGARKVIAGLTTVEEVVSITVGDAR